MIVGIDLGTSTSEVAYVDVDGKVVVIPNKEDNQITPSVVHIKPNGMATVGSEAREYLFTRPDCTFMEVKRMFGTGQKLTAHERVYSPEDIQSRIIEYLVDCAEEYTGEDVTGAVITVPAYFTDIQRKQTIKAGALAGINVERVINEPTAAALDFGLSNMSECEYILIYDFGGGTLDVTVLELFEGVIDVKSSCGNNTLGGKDFDEVLMKHIAGRHYKKLIADTKAEMKLKQAAIDCKTVLSSEQSTEVRLPLILADISIDCTVTRKEFENLIKPLVDSTGEQIDVAMQDAGLSQSDLNRVILVGGTTRIPCVRSFVQNKLGINIGMTDVDEQSPELMVVRGAAIAAAIKEGIIPEERSLVLADVCPYSLGLKVYGHYGCKIDQLIKRNVTIPYKYSKVYSAFYEYQDEIHIEIYQGESEHPQENVHIGHLNLEKLPQRKNEIARAEITFSYDVSGVLNVTARALGNDSTAAAVIDINNIDMPSRPPVKLSEWTKADGASKYRPLLKKAEKILDKHIGTANFLDSKLFLIFEDCEELKAEIILGNMEEAEEIAGRIKSFADYWETFNKFGGKSE